MIVTCPECAARYRIRRHVPAQGAHVKCPACVCAFHVSPSDLEEESSASPRVPTSENREPALAPSLESDDEEEEVTEPVSVPPLPATLLSTPTAVPEQVGPPPAPALPSGSTLTPAPPRGHSPRAVPPRRDPDVGRPGRRWGPLGAVAAIALGLALVCAGFVGTQLGADGRDSEAAARTEPLALPASPALVVPEPQEAPEEPRVEEPAPAQDEAPEEAAPEPPATPAAAPTPARRPARPKPKPKPRTAPQPPPEPEPVAAPEPAPAGTPDAIKTSDLVDPWQ